MKKIFTSLIAMVLLLNLSVFANANDTSDSSGNEGIDLYYLYTNNVTSNLAISSKTATCIGTVKGISGKTTKIVMTVYLQKKNGTSWSNVTSKSKTVNGTNASLTFQKASLSSGSYRVRTVAKVYNGTKYETASANSSTVSC